MTVFCCFNQDNPHFSAFQNHAELAVEGLLKPYRVKTTDNHV